LKPNLYLISYIRSLNEVLYEFEKS
jgi:hypothetical protein